MPGAARRAFRRSSGAGAGRHPRRGAVGGCPSRCAVHGREPRSLDVLIARRPRPSPAGEESLARFGPRLPFLLKVLSARSALSIQSHPTREGPSRVSSGDIGRRPAHICTYRRPGGTSRSPRNGATSSMVLRVPRARIAVLATLERFAHTASLWTPRSAPQRARDGAAAWQDALTPPRQPPGHPADGLVPLCRRSSSASWANPPGSAHGRCPGGGPSNPRWSRSQAGR